MDLSFIQNLKYLQSKHQSRPFFIRSFILKQKTFFFSPYIEALKSSLSFQLAVIFAVFFVCLTFQSAYQNHSFFIFYNIGIEKVPVILIYILKFSLLFLRINSILFFLLFFHDKLLFSFNEL